MGRDQGGPSEAKRQKRILTGFIVALATLAAVVSWLATRSLPPFSGSLTSAVTLLLFGVIGERTRLNMYNRGTVSPSATILVAGAILLGPIGSGLLAVAFTTLGSPLRYPVRRRLFNMASSMCAGVFTGTVSAIFLPGLNAVMAGMSQALGHSDWNNPLLMALPLGLFLSGTLYTINVGIGSSVLSLMDRLPLLLVYREQMAWLAPYTLAYGTIGAGAAMAAVSLGPLALGFFAIPMFAVARATAQEIARTRQLVETLQATRDRLQDALTTVQENEQLLTTMVVELQHANDETIGAFSAMLDARDHETEGHSERVVGYALTLARALGVPDDALPALSLGARLHDIGKVAIPDAILLKPGPLSTEEWAVMREHPHIGTKLVRGKPSLQRAIPVIRHHHERFDGAGYPDSLRGEQIPLAARIFAVSDVFDALVSDRPYRPGMTVETASRIINEGSGTQFDPVVVVAFNALIAAGTLAPPGASATCAATAGAVVRPSGAPAVMSGARLLQALDGGRPR